MACSTFLPLRLPQICSMASPKSTPEQERSIKPNFTKASLTCPHLFPLCLVIPGSQVRIVCTKRLAAFTWCLRLCGKITESLISKASSPGESDRPCNCFFSFFSFLSRQGKHLHLARNPVGRIPQTTEHQFQILQHSKYICFVTFLHNPIIFRFTLQRYTDYEKTQLFFSLFFILVPIMSRYTYLRMFTRNFYFLPQ